MPGVEIGAILFSLSQILVLDHGWANIFYKGPDNKYFQLHQPYSLHAIIQLCHCSTTAAIVSMSKKGHGYAPIKTLKKKKQMAVYI